MAHGNRVCLAVLFVLAFHPAPSSAQTASSTWNGGTGNWSNATSWTPTGIPGATSGTFDGPDVYIDGGKAISSQVFFDLLNANILNLTIDSGDTLQIGNGNTLLVLQATNVAGTLTIGSQATLQTGNAAPISVLAGGILNNSGHIGGRIYINEGAVLNNTGSVPVSDFEELVIFGTLNNLQGGFVGGSDTPNPFAFHVGSTGVFNNAGDVSLGKVGPIEVQGTFVNQSSGTLTLHAGTELTVSGSLLNAGTVTLGGIGSLIFADDGSTDFVNSGIINIDADSGIFVNGTVAVSGGGTINLMAQGLSPGCCFPTIASGGPGSLFPSGVNTFINLDNTIQGGGFIGGPDWLGSQNNLRVINAGSIVANATAPLVINAGNGFLNVGLVKVEGGSTLIFESPTYLQTGGTTQVDGTLESTLALLNMAGGNLTGSGTIIGDVMLGGNLNPGAIGTGGALTIQGSFTQQPGGTVSIDIGGLTPGAEYDQLTVSNLVTLSGLLNLNLLGGYLPQLGDSFVILLFGSLNGAFAGINGANFAPGLIFTVQYNANDVTLHVAQTPEPGTLLLLGTGLAAILGMRRRMKGASSPSQG